MNFKISQITEISTIWLRPNAGFFGGPFGMTRYENIRNLWTWNAYSLTYSHLNTLYSTWITGEPALNKNEFDVILSSSINNTTI